MPRVIKIPARLQVETKNIGNVVKRKVAGYARVSTDQEEQQTSYEAQLDYYQRYITAHEDWEFAGMYSDEGISGTSTKRRDGFNRMIQDALDGKIELIITKSVSRFARNTVDSLTTIRKLKAEGIEVYFEKENIHTLDSKGEVLLTIMASLAQEESRSISENVKWGHHKRFADGKEYVAFSRFLGYDRGPNGELVVNPEQAKVVRLIYGEFLTGLSYSAIAKKLTELDIKTPSGKSKWSPNSVQSILTNEKYAGDALLQKFYTADYLTKKQVKNTGEVPQYYVEGIHEAIIDKPQFARVQDEVAKRSRASRYSGVYIFSSKIKCGDCGNWYGSKVWHSTDKYRRVIWQCNHKYKSGKNCDTPHLTEKEIKQAFVRVINRLMPARDELVGNLHILQQQSFDITDLITSERKLEDELNIVYDLVQEDIERNARVARNQAEYREHHDELVKRYEELDCKLKKVKTEIQQKQARGRELGAFIAAIEQAPQVIKDFDEALWGSMVDHITVYTKDDLRFTLRDGSDIKA